MRLTYLPSETLLTYFEIPALTLTNTTLMITNAIHNLLATTSTYTPTTNLFNILIEPYTQPAYNLCTYTALPHLSAYLNYQTQFLLYIHTIIPTLPTMTTTWLPLTATTAINWNLMTTLTALYIAGILWYAIPSLAVYTASHTNTTKNIHLLMFIWALAGLDKLESTEEALSLAILWPWCFLIVFTHLTALADHSILFGFSEWGLPVTYGLVMLTEHCWSMGTYIFIYLAGTRGRKLSLLAALEDLVALLILIARVLLQAVRGVIVGMFHFISRELLWNMSKFWTTNAQTADATQLAATQLTPKYFLTDLLMTGTLAASSFVVITGIMFLQLIFLLVSVWLFCKCWFISWNKC